MRVVHRARRRDFAHRASVSRRAPPIISHEALAGLYAQGASIAENTFAAGVRKAVHFEAHLDFLVHRLAGLPLADAERVDVHVTTRGASEIAYAFSSVPFDRERGEVLIACQRHFGPFPADVIIEVSVHRKHAPPTTATYDVPHLGPQQ